MFATHAGSRALAEGLPGQPLTSIWHADPASSNCILNWDPSTDPDAAFNTSTVPLAARVAKVVNVNPHAHAGQGGVSALVAFNQPNNNYSQGSASQDIYAPTYWQYMTDMVYWGGSAGSGSILAPSGPIIDAAHRNGVRMLGNVFLAPKVYGGTLTELNAFLAHRADGSFPVADKMILAATTYGFDGWFINQETGGGDAATALKMQSFINYLHAKAPALHVQWYDAMTKTGRVGWQGQLDVNNEQFFSTMAGGKPHQVADSMFLDFRWESSTTNLINSAKRAKNFGRSPYELFSGVDFESREYAIASAVDKVFGSGGDHLTSLGIYRPEYTYDRSNKADLNDFYHRDSVFWVGQNADPADTTTTKDWKGIANYVAPQSVVKGDTFITNFDIGTGNQFMIDGVQMAAGDWYNLGLQDVLPTYRWMIQSTGAKLTAALDHADAYYGGTSLLISGTLNATNDIRLYQTELIASAGTKFKIELKTSQADSHTKLVLSFADAPNTYTYIDLPTGLDPTKWNTVTLDLGAYAGKTVASLGLRIGADTTPAIPNFSLRIGQFVMFHGTQDIPSAPTNLTVENEADIIKAAASLGTPSIPLRMHWTRSTSKTYVYNVYERTTDGTLNFLGATPNNAYFIPAIARPKSNKFVTVEVEAISSTFGASTHATRQITFGPPSP